MNPVVGIFWLEPLLPEFDHIPPETFEKCDRFIELSIRLQQRLPKETAEKISSLIAITNSFYSNLIEGQFTEPVEVAKRAPKKTREQLYALAVDHVRAQRLFERLLDRKPLDWDEMFHPMLLSMVHRKIFCDPNSKPSSSHLFRSQDVRVGEHVPPSHLGVPEMIQRMHEFYGMQRTRHKRLLSVMAYHHRLAWVHPWEDGNGRTIRLITHLQLRQMGLGSGLWSLSRGLARGQKAYYDLLHEADQQRAGALDGRGQLTQRGLLRFIDFMLETGIDQMQYTLDALEPGSMRSRLDTGLLLAPEAKGMGLKPEIIKAIHLLLLQGRMSRADFKSFTGLGDKTAQTQLSILIKMGLVESKTPKARDVTPGMPFWLAELIFPNLHKRFGLAG